MDQAAQLFNPFNPRAVEFQDNVVLFNTGFAGGGILVYHHHFYSALFFQFERADALGSDVLGINAQIRATVVAGTPRTRLARFCKLLYINAPVGAVALGAAAWGRAWLAWLVTALSVRGPGRQGYGHHHQ